LRRIFGDITDASVKLFIVRGAWLVKLLAMRWNIAVYSRSISSIRLYSIWPPRI